MCNVVGMIRTVDRCLDIRPRQAGDQSQLSPWLLAYGNKDI